LNAIKISTDSILFWNKRNPGVLPELFIEELKQISDSSQRIDEIIKHMRLFWVNPEIDRFKGKIEHTNNKEGGATFFISFPLSNSETEEEI